MKQAITLFVAIIVISSCGYHDKMLTISGVAYVFPADHKAELLDEQASGRGAFVRTHPPLEPFNLILSPRHYRSNKQGGEVPTIHWVNGLGSDADVMMVNGQKVVCTSADVRIHFSCGIRVIDAGLRWAAVFDRDQVVNAALIHKRAVKYLEGYRLAAL